MAAWPLSISSWRARASSASPTRSPRRAAACAWRSSSATRAPRRSSVQNFGFITVTGQAEGETRARALRSREVWLEVAAAAGIADRAARCPDRRAPAREALAVLEEFAATPGGEGCEMLDARCARQRLPAGVGRASWARLRARTRSASRRARRCRAARWLEERRGVTFIAGARRSALEANGPAPRMRAWSRPARSSLRPAIGCRRVCAGNSRAATQPAPMHAADDAGARDRVGRLPAVVMGDLSLLRYEGFAQRAGAPPRLRERLEAEQRAHARGGRARHRGAGRRRHRSSSAIRTATRARADSAGRRASTKR